MEGKKLLKGGLITADTLATTVALFPRVPVNAAEAPKLTYEAHVSNEGWLAWVTADESENLESNFAGTTGEARRMEALEIAIVKTEVAKAQDAAVVELTSFVENSALKKYSTRK